mgnify:CR=1 FL=1
MALTVYQPVFSRLLVLLQRPPWQAFFKPDSKADPANNRPIWILSWQDSLKKQFSIRYINTWTTISYSLNFNDLGLESYTPAPIINSSLIFTDNWYFNPCCVFSCSSANILKVIFENDKKHFLDHACKEVLFEFFSFLLFFSCQLHVMTKKDQYCSKFR